MLGDTVLQSSGATLAIGGVVATAVALWVFLWATNKYERKMAETQ